MRALIVEFTPFTFERGFFIREKSLIEWINNLDLRKRQRKKTSVASLLTLTFAFTIINIAYNKK